MTELSYSSQVIKALQAKGWSKWQIHNELNVSWQTVHAWSRDIFQPSAKRFQTLLALLSMEQASS